MIKGQVRPDGKDILQEIYAIERIRKPQQQKAENLRKELRDLEKLMETSETEELALKIWQTQKKMREEETVAIDMEMYGMELRNELAFATRTVTEVTQTYIEMFLAHQKEYELIKKAKNYDWITLSEK